ncbi:MAG: aminotransferase class V-fold PLP-dependent enzyme [Candidatus Woesearchaeota archaeon]
MYEEKISLNHVRYHYFLDPCGTNRVRFEEVVYYLTKSLLDWYLPGNEEVQKDPFLEVLKKSSKSEEELLKLFEERKKIRAKKAIPDSLQPDDFKTKFALGSFPTQGLPLEEVILDLDKHTDPSVRFNQYFNGEMHPHDNIPAFAAGFVSKFLNANAIAHCVSPSLSYMETLTTRWLAELVGYDHSASGLITEELNPEQLKKLELIPSGNIVCGGTVANLTALLVARNKLLRDKTGSVNDIGVEEKGLLEYGLGNDIPGVVMFCSENAHYSIQKLAGYIGIGSQNVILIGVDEQGRMRPELLQAEIEKAKANKKKVLAVVATAGTTGNGAIDPLEKIADITEREQIYLHVDAAHGGGFLTSEKMKPKFKGIERADSVTIDGHKMLYTNYPCGGIVFKNKLDPVESLKQSAKYILDRASEHYNLGKSTVEGSRSTDGTLQLYASIRALGKEGYELIVDHTVAMTRYLYEAVQQSPVLEAFHEPEMNVLCLRYIPQGWDRKTKVEEINELNVRLNENIYRDGEFYLGETEMKKEGQNCKVQRAIIMHPYVETYDLDRLVRKVEEIGGNIAKRMGERE